MKELLESFTEWFKEKTTSPLYGTFIASIIFWNWKFFYVLFLQEEDKFLIPKIEYIQKYFIDNQTFWYHPLHFLVLPTISTYLIIWWVPIISNYALKRSTSFYFNRKGIFDMENNLYEKNKIESLRILKETTIEQAEVLKELVSESKKKKEIETEAVQSGYGQDIMWEEEYQKFKKSNYFKIVDSINKLIYRYEGSPYNEFNQRAISSEDIAYAHTNGLIGLVRGSTEKYVLTEKGKFFIKRHFDEK